MFTKTRNNWRRWCGIIILLALDQTIVSVEMGNCSSTKSLHIQERDSGSYENTVFIDKTRQSNGCPRTASIYSQQGSKCENQDAALFYQGFGTEERSFFGVFDGHGRDGHVVSKLVRNRLPALILSQQKGLAGEDFGYNINGESMQNCDWRRACVGAFKLMDKELKLMRSLDFTWSGSTAVTIIMQGGDLVISNLGDSRAILGTISPNDELITVQLTNDLRPGLPNELERIRKCNGRVFALKAEPHVQRVWLPYANLPGLAMSRTFGDFGIKNYGVIDTPQMAYHHVTDKDQFLVLATDGVWDVLTNDQVVSIVSSITNQGKAAKAVVDAAVKAWKDKYPSAKIDDCTAVCLFLGETRHDKHLVYNANATTSAA